MSERRCFSTLFSPLIDDDENDDDDDHGKRLIMCCAAAALVIWYGMVWVDGWVIMYG